MIAADVLDKLKGFGISRRDRQLLYGAIVGNATLIIALIVVLVVLAFYNRDGKTVGAIVDTLIWSELGLIIVFVGGTVEQRRIAARTMSAIPKPPEP